MDLGPPTLSCTSSYKLTSKKELTMSEPITLEIFTDYV
jgi:hypothetical protein